MNPVIKSPQHKRMPPVLVKLASYLVEKEDQEVRSRAEEKRLVQP